LREALVFMLADAGGGATGCGDTWPMLVVLRKLGNLRVAAILGCMTSSVMVRAVGILVIWIILLLVPRSSLVVSGSCQSHVFHIRGVSPSPLSPDGVDDGVRVLVVRKIVGLDEGIVDRKNWEET
jgi:hypothetical protein